MTHCGTVGHSNILQNVGVVGLWGAGGIMERGMGTVRAFFDHTRRHHWLLGTFISIVLTAVGSALWYGYVRITSLTAQTDALVLQVDTLEAHLNYKTTLLAENITKTETSLSEALSQEKQNVETIKTKLGSFEQEVDVISGTVQTLDKLSKTDPELLQKYSKVYFLNEHYEPKLLTTVPSGYTYSEKNEQQIHAQVWPRLKQMLDAAEASGQEIYVFSAYRSFETQQFLKGQYTVTYGSGANTFSADQGYSEHQLGTTVDLITTGLGGELAGFEKTASYTWLTQNAYQYGFILSYPNGNSYYVFEPWHWRFGGVSLATYLNSAGKNFYDLEQSVIDTYLVSIFD
ncbi:D-alanyl-D-alanine carboxypeptidase family protein [Candidatus Uhrbacteria bacterium]|nr:D-alanyl-D-alanine carboxypeptidase family protein [Candidatus Uhrbacteria bacterium]